VDLLRAYVGVIFDVFVVVVVVIIQGGTKNKKNYSEKAPFL
jgi:hypothetical protein